MVYGTDVSRTVTKSSYVPVDGTKNASAEPANGRFDVDSVAADVGWSAGRQRSGDQRAERQKSPGHHEISDL